LSFSRRYAGRRLGVTYVRLDRAKQQRRPTVLAVGGQQRLHLDRVAQLRRGSMSFEHVDVSGREAGLRQGRPDDLLLGWPVGRGQPVGGTVGVDGCPADHGQHAVAVAPRVRAA
jgi:hypothetical protein